MMPGIEEMEAAWMGEKQQICARMLEMRGALEYVHEQTGRAMDWGSSNETVRKCYVATAKVLRAD